jgi:hypothetical protein
MNRYEFNHFSGTEHLTNVVAMSRKDAAVRFPGVQFKSCDSFSVWVGQKSNGETVPTTRIVEWKVNGKRHECDARCRNATGRNCECACRGRYHGAGN